MYYAFWVLLILNLLFAVLNFLTGDYAVMAAGIVSAAAMVVFISLED